MGEMISNIWQLNALLSGVLVFLLLVLTIFMTLIAVVFAPFRHKNDEYE